MRAVVRLATQDDLESIMALEARHYIGNLEPADRSDGFISILHSHEWFSQAVDSGGVHVAVMADDEVVGFIVVTAPPDRTAADLPPVIKAMLDLAETLEFAGTPIARNRYAFRGPVCIATKARGRGIYSAFKAVTDEAYSDRFDIGVLFVSAGNPRSLHTTTTKLGARALAEFEAAGQRFHFVAFPFGDRCRA